MYVLEEKLERQRRSKQESVYGYTPQESFKFVHFFVFHPTITFLAVLLSEQGREPTTNSTPTYVVNAGI